MCKYIILIMDTLGFSQELGHWRWADDTAEMTHDKEAHLVGSFGLYYFFRHKDYTAVESIIYSVGLGLAKETIDAIVPWEEYGKWGGDGFSKYDLYYNVLGVTGACIIDVVWKPKKKKDLILQIRPNSFQIKYSFN